MKNINKKNLLEYDISKEIEKLTQRRIKETDDERKIIELYLIRQGFKYSEKESYIHNEDDNLDELVYKKDIFMPIQETSLPYNKINYKKLLRTYPLFNSRAGIKNL